MCKYCAATAFFALVALELYDRIFYLLMLYILHCLAYLVHFPVSVCFSNTGNTPF